jgi:hypothetical protein
MAQPTLLDRIKNIISSLAFRVFLWAEGITQGEYLGMIYEEAAREYKSEKANNWMLK